MNYSVLWQPRTLSTTVFLCNLLPSETNLYQFTMSQGSPKNRGNPWMPNVPTPAHLGEAKSFGTDRPGNRERFPPKNWSRPAGGGAHHGEMWIVRFFHIQVRYRFSGIYNIPANIHLFAGLVIDEAILVSGQISSK